MSKVTFDTVNTRVSALATAIGNAIRETREDIGDKRTLKTTEKGSLVGAVNELVQGVSELRSDMEANIPQLNDNGAPNSYTTYSTSKVVELIQQASGGGVTIDDNTSGLDKTFSSAKIESLVQAVPSQVTGYLLNDHQINSDKTYSSQKIEDRLQSVKDNIAREVLDDTTAFNNKTYSSDKIDARLTEVQSSLERTFEDRLKALVGEAPEAFDTLKEISDHLQNNAPDLSGILTALNNRLRVDEVMSLSEDQKQNVAQSLGLTDVDFVAVFNAALNGA